MVTRKKPAARSTASLLDIPLSFKDALNIVYQENPCLTLPNALWKTTQTLHKYETSYTYENGKVTELKIFDDEHLMMWWQRGRAITLLTQAETEKLKFALLHQKYIENINTSLFDLTPYFRFIHRHRGLPPEQPHPGFALAPVRPLLEAEMVAGVINQCYPDMHMPAETVRSWTEHPVFDPALWLWVIDTETGCPAGLGIAEYDPEVQEGSIEWVQVLGEYRGHGLGKFVSLELLNRLRKKARFTTVSGRQHNDTRPDILYRKLGFQGHDIWWVLRKKSLN